MLRRKRLDGHSNYYWSNDRHVCKQNEAKTENPKIKYVTMLLLPPDYSAVQPAARVNMRWIQSPRGASLSTEKLEPVTPDNRHKRESGQRLARSKATWHSHCASRPTQTVNIYRLIFVVQIVKLILLYLDLAWHKWKITTLKAFSAGRSEIACRGKVNWSEWHTIKEGKRELT